MTRCVVHTFLFSFSFFSFDFIRLFIYIYTTVQSVCCLFVLNRNEKSIKYCYKSVDHRWLFNDAHVCDGAAGLVRFPVPAARFTSENLLIFCDKR